MIRRMTDREMELEREVERLRTENAERLVELNRCYKAIQCRSEIGTVNAAKLAKAREKAVAILEQPTNWLVHGELARQIIKGIDE